MCGCDVPPMTVGVRVCRSAAGSAGRDAPGHPVRLEQQEAAELGLNDIGRVKIRTTQPLFVDDYARNRATGRFILVDEATNATVGAGIDELRGLRA